MRKPPCRLADGTACPGRRPGCQDSCKMMKHWQEEKAAEKRYMAGENSSTLSENGKREIWKNMRYGVQNRRHTA